MLSGNILKEEVHLIIGFTGGLAKEVLPYTQPRQLSVPGLVSPDMTLDDDCFLFEELEIPPAKEASNVPLDGDGGPCLSAAPLIL